MSWSGAGDAPEPEVVGDDATAPAETQDGAEGAPIPARERPFDPLGTRPRHDPDELLPKGPQSLWVEGSLAEDEDVEGRPPLPTGPIGSGDGGSFEAAESEEDSEERVAAVTGAATTSHTPRFQFVTGALIAVAAAAIVAFAAILAGGGTKDDDPFATSGPRWSTWEPTKGNGDGATQIADHVGREYKLPDGKQLVLVTGGPLEAGGIPLQIVERQPAAQGGGIVPVDSKKTIMYRMCGLGDACAIAEGKPSTDRAFLLRREALEMALYSFRYTDADTTLVLLPPTIYKPSSAQIAQAVQNGATAADAAKPAVKSLALYFTRSMVKSSLGQPLTATLVSRTPSVTSAPSSPDATVVQQLTGNVLFQTRVIQANQEPSGYIVLEDPSEDDGG